MSYRVDGSLGPSWAIVCRYRDGRPKWWRSCLSNRWPVSCRPARTDRTTPRRSGRSTPTENKNHFCHVVLIHLVAVFEKYTSYSFWRNEKKAVGTIVKSFIQGNLYNFNWFGSGRRCRPIGNRATIGNLSWASDRSEDGGPCVSPRRRHRRSFYPPEYVRKIKRVKISEHVYYYIRKMGAWRSERFIQRCY